MSITKKELEQLVKIANEKIVTLENRANLEAACMDERDFFDVSVWELKDVLIAAYELGKKSKFTDLDKEQKTYSLVAYNDEKISADDIFTTHDLGECVRKGIEYKQLLNDGFLRDKNGRPYDWMEFLDDGNESYWSSGMRD